MNRNTLIAVVLLGAGCPTVASTITLFGTSVTSFDDRLPNTIEEVFDTCHGTFSFSATSLVGSQNLAGACWDPSGSAYGSLSSNGKSLASAWKSLTVDTRSPMTAVDISDAATIHRVYGNIVDGEWEDASLSDHECSVTLDWRDLEVDTLTIDDLDVEWIPGASRPTLKLTFDFANTSALASGYLGFDVDCDGSWLKETIIGNMLPDDDDYDLRPRNLEVAVLFRLTSVSGGTQHWSIGSTSSMDGIRANPTFPSDFQDNVGTLKELMEAHAGITTSDIAELVEAEVKDAVADFEPLLATQISTQLPSGNEICSVSVHGDQEIVYVTSKPSCD